jgi:hypothetical protein
MSDATTDYVLSQILSKARYARAHDNYGVLSTGEALAAALVLNRADWLVDMQYTILEAVERVGPTWMGRLPRAAAIVAADVRDDG